MPIVPNLIERFVLLRLNRGPGPFLDLLAMGSFRAVTAALDLGVFETLADGARTAPSLATEVDADTDALDSLCALLVEGGYLRRDTDDSHEVYALTAMSRRWLTDAEGTNMGPWLVAWDEVVLPFWDAELDRTLREGGPSTDIYTWAAETGRADTLHAGFRAAARLAREDALAVVPVPERAGIGPADGPVRLLDVGGGHGLYAAAFAAENPELEATVLDHPAARPVFDETVAEAGVADRVRFRSADYLTDDLRNPDADEGAEEAAHYDLAFLFNVVHAHEAATNRALLERVRAALRPGGQVAVLDQFTGDGRTPVARAGTRFVDLTYRVTLGAHTYPADEVEQWLRDAGFVDVRTERRFSGLGFVLGTAPGT